MQGIMMNKPMANAHKEHTFHISGQDLHKGTRHWRHPFGFYRLCQKKTYAPKFGSHKVFMGAPWVNNRDLPWHTMYHYGTVLISLI